MNQDPEEWFGRELILTEDVMEIEAEDDSPLQQSRDDRADEKFDRGGVDCILT
jgi:hypothetical protein